MVIGVALAIGIEVVVNSLHDRKRWAWIAGLCVLGLNLSPVLYLLGTLGLHGLLNIEASVLGGSTLGPVLGVLGLWGLLSKGSRTEFSLERAGREGLMDEQYELPRD